ncbi:MAG: AI-2E family transporter [Anaerolineales bacterium]
MKTQWSREFRYFFATAALILLIWVAWHVRAIFPPLIIAALIAYLLSPLVHLLMRHSRLSRRAAANLVFFVALALLIAVPAGLTPILLSELDTLTADLNMELNSLQEILKTPIDIGGFGLYFGQIIPGLRQTLTQNPLAHDAFAALGSASRGGAWFLVIVVCAYYFMVDWEALREWLIGLAAPEYQQDARRLYKQIRAVWLSYLRGQITLMLIVGVVFTVIWTVIGLPYALVIGLLTGLFSLVPDVGPLAATALAVFVALIQGSAWLPLSNLAFAALVAAIYAVLINIKNIWLRPRIMGRSVNMHEGLVFVAIVAAVIFTGVLGALIIVPVLASLGVLGAYFRRRLLGLEPFDNQ